MWCGHVLFLLVVFGRFTSHRLWDSERIVHSTRRTRTTQGLWEHAWGLHGRTQYTHTGPQNSGFSLIAPNLLNVSV